jgi:hypothetical protein
MGISIRAYARHRGVSDAAVRKAIKSGRITPEADGTLDADKTDREWNRNTEPPAPPRRAEPVSASQAAPEPSAPSLSTGGTSLLQARTVNEVVKAQTNKVRLARLKGDLVDRSQAIAHVFQLARNERDAWLNWPARVSAQMAATLGMEPHALHIALDEAVRTHLMELGELRPKVD